MNWKEMTEKELREAKEPWPKTRDELAQFIDTMTERSHDYGTCCYAMSLCAVAAFNYVAGKLGCTGFQASLADLDIIRRTRGIKGPFAIRDYSNLLYPQYCTDEYFPSWEKLIADKDIGSWLKQQAENKLAEKGLACGEVVDHWMRLASMPTLTTGGQ